MKFFQLLGIFSFITATFLFFSSPTMAQFGTVRGFVYEEETGEPVIFTNVYFYKTSMGAPTDENGYFAITRIPPGDYTLLVGIWRSMMIQAGAMLLKSVPIRRSPGQGH